MSNSIYIDLDSYSAEDNVKLTYLKFGKKKISSINILKSKIELNLQDESYTALASKEYTKNTLIFIIKKVVKKSIRLFIGSFDKSDKSKKFNEICII